MSRSRNETMAIEDLRVLEVLNNPMRLRILYQLTEPSTIREVAETLGVPVTRLYHHVNLLESVGVVEVVEVRKSGARLQRVYQTRAGRFEPGPGLLSDLSDKQRIAEVVAGIVLDGARLDAIAGLLQRLEEIEETGDALEESAGTLGRSVVALSPEGALAFSEKLKALIDEMSEMEDRNGREYALSLAFFPMVGPVKGDSL